jgi:Domain of unknown function (DUF4388)/PilZ domain
MAFQGRLETTPLLELLQILAYSGKSGLLTVKGGETRGLVIFQEGNVVCAYSPTALPLLVKAAKEADPAERLSLRRIQVLASLRELFDLPEGDYRFVRGSKPVPELQGLDIKVFYADGALDTGDLLVALETAMDSEPQVVQSPAAVQKSPAHQRRHERFGPIIIKGELRESNKILHGVLTNLSLGGTFFHADELPALDTVCELHFTLPEELGTCQVGAKVVWLRSEGVNTKRGAGLAFQSLPGDCEERISTYLRRFQDLASDVEFQS